MIGELTSNKYLWISIGILTLLFCIEGNVLWSGGYVFEMIVCITAAGSSTFIIPRCLLPFAIMKKKHRLPTDIK